MSIVVTFHPKCTEEDYYRCLDELVNDDEYVQLHREAHYASVIGGELQVVDVWDSEEAFNDFAVVLLPILAKVGIDPGVPEIRRLIRSIPSGITLVDDAGIKCWNDHDVEGWVSLFGDVFSLTDPGLPRTITDRAGVRDYMRAWFRAFPDMQIHQTDRVVSHNRVAGFVEFTGTHLGQLDGPHGPIMPTERHVLGGGAYVATVGTFGKIVSFASMPDMIGLLLQLGVDFTGTAAER